MGHQTVWKKAKKPNFDFWISVRWRRPGSRYLKIVCNYLTTMQPALYPFPTLQDFRISWDHRRYKSRFKIISEVKDLNGGGADSYVYFKRYPSWFVIPGTIVKVTHLAFKSRDLEMIDSHFSSFMKMGDSYRGALAYLVITRRGVLRYIGSLYSIFFNKFLVTNYKTRYHLSLLFS